MFTKVSKSKWRDEYGATIIKYRMADRYYFLLYAPGEPLEIGDYNSFVSLSEAKHYTPAQRGHGE